MRWSIILLVWAITRNLGIAIVTGLGLYLVLYVIALLVNGSSFESIRAARQQKEVEKAKREAEEASAPSEEAQMAGVSA